MIGTCLIGVLVNVALDVSPVETKSDCMMSKGFVCGVVQLPSWTSCDIPRWRPSAVRNLIEGCESKLRQRVVPRCSCHQRQCSGFRGVQDLRLGTIAVIAIQIAQSRVIGQGCGKSVFPVKARNWRVLGSCRRFCGDDRREFRRRVVARKLAPPEEIEMVLIAI